MDDRCDMDPPTSIASPEGLHAGREGPLGRDTSQDALPFMYQEGGGVTLHPLTPWNVNQVPFRLPGHHHGLRIVSPVYDPRGYGTHLHHQASRWSHGYYYRDQQS